ncbi:NAD-dependent epimerase/dehydratase family protein [Amycolatopsis sp. NPDC051372]|uniref:NAD-dependent epimerase/dehydratase family protein n=1 Tax=unclassified Amycolatopsis TaxID=2618356 RepID=UPI00341FA086
MRIVITGASGNIGTALLRELDSSWEVTGVARRVPDLTAEPYANVSWLHLDLGEPGAEEALARAFAGADAVVHLAWAISPVWDEPAMWRTNQDGTRHVLDAAAKAGVGHVVCASSVAAYGPGPRDEKVAEEFPRAGVPASAYSRGKAELEEVLDAFVETHPEIELARIRPCAVLQRPAAGEFTRWLLGPLISPGLLGGRLLPVPLWDGLRVQAVHSDDVASALRLILEQRAVGPFNLAAPDVLDANALARLFGGARVPVRKSVARFVARVAWTAGLQPLHPGWLELADRAALVDTTRAEVVLGWQPRHSTEDTLAELVDGLRAKAAGASPPLARASAGWRTRVRALGRLRPTHQSQA